MASLRKRPESQQWVCCYTLPDGTRTQKSTKQSDRKKAWAICLQWEALADRARQMDLTEAQARKAVAEICERAGMRRVDFASVEDFFSRWIQSKEITKSAGTTRRYKDVSESFLTFLGERKAKPLGSLAPADISDFRDLQITEGKSASTANMCVKTLRIALNIARRQSLIFNNPAEAVDLLPTSRNQRRTFSREQINQLLKEADIHWRGMILFGACHGLRLGDAAKLKWSNLDLERRTLVFYPKKTSQGVNPRPEEYPLHPDIEEYVTTLPVPSNDPNTLLFPPLARRKLNGRTGLSAQFRGLMHKVGIFTAGEAEERKKGKGRRFFDLGFHSLRHTSISEMANRGVNKEVRMKLSGHRSAVHERYTHHDLGVLRTEIERVPSFLRAEDRSNKDTRRPKSRG